MHGVVVFTILVCTSSLQISRRTLLSRSRNIAPFIFVSGAVGAFPRISHADAAKGSFALDLEYYGKNVIGQVIKQDKRQQLTGFESKPIAGPNPSCPSDSVELRKEVGSFVIQSFIDTCESRKPGFSARYMETLSGKFGQVARREFEGMCGNIDSNEKDPRFFNFASYCLYRTAARDFPLSEERLSIVDNVGNSILNYLNVNNEIFEETQLRRESSATSFNGPLKLLISKLCSAGFMEDAKIVDGAQNSKEDSRAFDSFDNEDLAAGREINLVISGEYAFIFSF